MLIGEKNVSDKSCVSLQDRGIRVARELQQAGRLRLEHVVHIQARSAVQRQPAGVTGTAPPQKGSYRSTRRHIQEGFIGLTSDAATWTSRNSKLWTSSTTPTRPQRAFPKQLMSTRTPDLRALNNVRLGLSERSVWCQNNLWLIS
jgi:hypothetical protein